MTGAVLLTVCLNLASMLLARGRGRRKEFVIRLALGGGRGRIDPSAVDRGTAARWLAACSVSASAARRSTRC